MPQMSKAERQLLVLAAKTAVEAAEKRGATPDPRMVDIAEHGANPERDATPA